MGWGGGYGGPIHSLLHIRLTYIQLCNIPHGYIETYTPSAGYHIESEMNVQCRPVKVDRSHWTITMMLPVTYMYTSSTVTVVIYLQYMFM